MNPKFWLASLLLIAPALIVAMDDEPAASPSSTAAAKPTITDEVPSRTNKPTSSYDIKQQEIIRLAPRFESTTWWQKLATGLIPGYFSAVTTVPTRAQPPQFILRLGDSVRQLYSFTNTIRYLTMLKSAINGIETGLLTAKLLSRSKHKNGYATACGLIGGGIAYLINRRCAQRITTEVENSTTHDEEETSPPFNTTTHRFKAHYLNTLAKALTRGQAVVNTCEGYQITTGHDKLMPLLKTEMSKNAADKQAFETLYPVVQRIIERHRVVNTQGIS